VEVELREVEVEKAGVGAALPEVAAAPVVEGGRVAVPPRAEEEERAGSAIVVPGGVLTRIYPATLISVTT
jgi:putative N-acetylmannosamine-6-phosphate epimerase